MANYSIQRSDVANGDVTVTEATANTTTNATLIGQNFTGYGDEIATNFLQHLEHFASATEPNNNARVPGSAAIQGQLWYDSGLGLLKVYDGSWQDMAKLALGTVTDSITRFDVTGRWVEETRVRITTGGTLEIRDNAETSWVTFNHNATNLIIDGVNGTVDIDITGVVAVNMPSITLVTPLAEIQGGTAQTAYATGDILFASGANTLTKLVVDTDGDVLTLVAGVPSWVTGAAGVSNLNDLGDVDLTGAIDNAILYRTGGNWEDSIIGNFGWDGSNLTVSNLNGIAAANIIDRAAPGTLQATTFAQDITMSTADIKLGDNDQIFFGTGDDVIMDFNSASSNFVITGTSQATDFLITNFTGDVLLDGVPLFIDNFEGEAIRLQGNTNGNALDTYIGFHRADGSTAGTIGVSSTGTNAIRIVGTEDGVEIVGSDANVKLDTGSSGNRIRLYNSGNDESLRTQVVGSSYSTRARIYTDIDNYSAGFNETKQVNISSGGTYNVTIDDIGLFLRKSTTSAVTVAFSNFSAPTGSTVLVNNDATGTCTISTPSASLEWIDGSGAAAPTGNRTLARNSIATLRKKSGSVWQIWGNGIS